MSKADVTCNWKADCVESEYGNGEIASFVEHHEDLDACFMEIDLGCCLVLSDDGLMAIHPPEAPILYTGNILRKSFEQSSQGYPPAILGLWLATRE